MKIVRYCFCFVLVIEIAKPSYSQVWARIIRMLTIEGRETVEIIEIEKNQTEKLVYSINDEEAISFLKKEHPGEELRNIHASEVEIAKLIRMKWERDNPVQAAYLKESSERLERAVKAVELLDYTHSDRNGKMLQPNSFVDGIETYISIPSTHSEYVNIFKTDEETAFKNTQYLHDKLKLEANKNLFFSSSAASLLSSIKKESRKAITIIGHNEEGNLFFPDGSSISFFEIDEAARKHDRVVVYLSCNAAEYTANPATAYALNYSDALDINRFIWLQLNSMDLRLSKDQAVDKINGFLNYYSSEKNRTLKLKIATYTTGGAGVIYGLYQIEKKE